MVLELCKAKINNPSSLANSIAHFSSLTWLDLSCAVFQRSFASANRVNIFIELFAKNLSQCQHIEGLLLSYCDFLVTDVFIKTISPKLVKLRHLDLRSCSQITDSSLHFIAYFLIQLQFLDISWCHNISDNGLDCGVEIQRNTKFLNEFNKNWNKRSCRCMRKYLDQPFLLMKARAELENETRSQLCDCPVGETNLIEDSTQIQLNILKENFSLKNLRNLKKVRMESCVNISDTGLIRGLNLHHLQELDIKLCTNVNGDFFVEAGKALNNLKTVNLNQCIKFKEENILWLVEHASNLKELSVSALPNVTDQLIECLRAKKRLLHVLDVSFCANIHDSAVELYEVLLYNEFGSHEFHLDKRFVSR